ncbi:MAG: sialate O-acetylesterase [Chitinophagaceae bacterium]
MQLVKSGWTFLAAGFIYTAATAQVKLPRLVRDSMVLQRDKPVHIWGWASRGEKIQVRFNGKKYITRTSNDGKWQLDMQPTAAGGPFQMDISGKNKIHLHDILVGDVWLCSGQSNMEHQLKLHTVYYPKEIAQAHYPEIRQFKVPNVTNLESPQSDLPGGNWKWANPENVPDFSAVAYFFAESLYRQYHIPIGLINVTWGGSPIEAWMSEESLATFPGEESIIEKNKDSAYVNSRNRAAAADVTSVRIPEDKGAEEQWYATTYQTAGKGWRPFAIPGYWEDQGVADLNGTVWFRKEIEVPAAIAQSAAKVFLGRIVDADALYINGKEVGATTYLYPQRRYDVPTGLLKPGKNTFAIRVTNYSGKGGFVPDKPYQLMGAGDTVSLTGYWQYKVSNVFTRHIPGVPPALTLQYQPTALFNAMLSPVIGYGIKGFIWYQGESNAGDAKGYASMQPAMITDWRQRWQAGNLPFLFVQLPGFMDYHYLPTESGWAAFREAQAKSLALPNTGMAVAIDLGEWNDIHPDRKKPIGQRLALVAQKVAYGENVVDAGPTYEKAVAHSNTLIISFSHTGKGLTTSDGEAPSEFAIAGADKKFYWAQATIEGNQIVLHSDMVPQPEYVRYAWADDPVNPNLINKEGLPAPPFRSDK